MKLLFVLSSLTATSKADGIAQWFDKYVEKSMQLFEKSAQSALDQQKKIAPLEGRISSILIAEQVVAEPLNWQRNTKRLAAITTIQAECGVVLTPEDKQFVHSVIKLIEFSAQVQSTTQEEITKEFLTSKNQAESLIKAGGSVDKKLFAEFSKSDNNEKISASEKNLAAKSEARPLTKEQSATFALLFSELLNSYSGLLKHSPDPNEILKAKGYFDPSKKR